jgi:triphosphoribosyl-dephospho-CoA synthase
MARDRDLVARQYGNEFADVLRLADWIEEGVARGWTNDTAIVHAYMRQLATEADSLIVRKCGNRIGEQARAMASCVVEAGHPGSDEYERGLADLDFWLRADGHRRNPGTTADLIAAALFVLLREGRLKLKR